MTIVTEKSLLWKAGAESKFPREADSASGWAGPLSLVPAWLPQPCGQPRTSSSWTSSPLRFSMLLFFRVKNLWVLIAPQDTHHPALLPTAALLRGRARDARKGVRHCHTDRSRKLRGLCAYSARDKSWERVQRIRYIGSNVKISLCKLIFQS